MSKFKKIASIFASAAMLTSTVALATATTYPAPFVQNGVPNVAVIYGVGAAPTDIQSASDIQMDLSGRVTDGGGGGGGGEPIEGENYALFSESSPLLLNDSINAARKTITSSHLPTVLKDTEFVATSGTSEGSTIRITHQINLHNYSRIIFAKEPKTDSSEPDIGVWLGTTHTNYLYEAVATFDKQVNFSDKESHREKLTLFGKEFTISPSTDSSSLVLFESSETLHLDDREQSKSVTVGGKQYTIKLLSASDDDANIEVTKDSGQKSSGVIKEGRTKRFFDIEITLESADEIGDRFSASLVMGSSTYKFKHNEEVRKGSAETPIEGTRVEFEGTTSNMTKLKIKVFANSSDYDFITNGQSFNDPVYGSFKLLFNGLKNNDDREEIEIKDGGNDRMTISFTNYARQELSNWEWLYAQNENTTFLSNGDTYRITVREGAQINKSHFVIVGNEEDAFLLKLTSVDNSTGINNDKIVFTNVFDDSKTYSATATSEGSGEISIGGDQYTFYYVDDGQDKEFVQLDYPDRYSSGSGVVVAYPSIATGKGAKLIFYEPLLFNVSDAHEASKRGATASTLSAIRIPDGDGFGSIDFYNFNPTSKTVNVSVGGSANVTLDISANNPNSADGLIGSLRWNVTAGEYDNTVKVFLEDIDGTRIARPAIVLIEEKDRDDKYNAVIVRTEGGSSNNKIGVDDVDFTWNGDTNMKGSAYGSSGFRGASNRDLYYMIDRYGTMVITDTSESDQHSVKISYPDEQVRVQLYMTEFTATAGRGTDGSIDSRVLFLTDNESANAATKHWIVVGGSCVNTVAAQLLQSSTPLCGASFTQITNVGRNEFLIQTFDRGGGKIATLVAGYEAGDTINAATAIRTENVMTRPGSKYIGRQVTGGGITLQQA